MSKAPFQTFLNWDWSALTPDMLNANAGTERGMDALRRSIEAVGVGRGPVIDADGNIIAGNKTAEVAMERGLKPKVVDIGPDEVLVARRADLHLYDPQDPRARDLATADNRVAELNLSWVDTMLEAAAKHTGSTAREQFWWPNEREAMAVDAATEDEELPEQTPLHVKESPAKRHVVVVTCPDETAKVELIEFAESRDWKVREA